MNQDDYIKSVVSGIIGFFGAYLLRYLEPKANAVFWNPHAFSFTVENLNIITNSVTIQNLGRKPAEKIEIIYQYKPDTYKIWPERTAEAKTNNDGNFIIQIESLGRKEYFSIESLHYRGLHPIIISARTKDGPIKPIQFYYQQVQPKWKYRATFALFLTGCGTVGYWVLKLLKNYW